MAGPYHPRLIANRFIVCAMAAGCPLTPLQVMKLTYIAHGWSLGLRDRRLITDTVQAWRYGPVIPSLYSRLKLFGSTPVRHEIKAGMFDAGRDKEIEADDLALVDDVYAKYGKFDGIQLSNLTHMKGTPWHQVYSPTEFNVPIPDSLIKSHYQELARQRAGG